MRLFASVALCLSVCVPVAALAHGAGTSYEVQIGEYLVDVGYQPDELVAGERVVFDFVIVKDGIELPFEEVWVRLQHGSSTLLATGIAQPTIGRTTLLYVLPQDIRSLTVHARFQNEQETMAEVSFMLPVRAGDVSIWEYWWTPILAGAVLGGGAAFFYRRGRSNVTL